MSCKKFVWCDIWSLLQQNTLSFELCGVSSSCVFFSVGHHHVLRSVLPHTSITLYLSSREGRSCWRKIDWCWVFIPREYYLRTLTQSGFFGCLLHLFLTRKEWSSLRGGSHFFYFCDVRDEEEDVKHSIFFFKRKHRLTESTCIFLKSDTLSSLVKFQQSIHEVKLSLKESLIHPVIIGFLFSSTPIAPKQAVCYLSGTL